MAGKPKTRFVQAYRATRRKESHPHLDPINVATFAADRDIALAKIGNLVAYQDYLVAARAAKARRKGVSLAFERNVQMQARQACADLQAFSGGVLRMVQQMNHTNIWAQTLNRLTSTLTTTGPRSAKEIWDEVHLNEEHRATLANHGLTPDRVAAVTAAISRLDARLVLHAGKVSVETRVPGESAPRRLSLKPSPGRPAGVVDLLRRSQFDKVVAAVSRNDPVYLEVVSTGAPVDYEVGQLFAIGAVAARQQMAEHVRRLEDTGLALHEGNDPVTGLIVLLVVGLFLGLVGSIIHHLCDDTDSDVQPPDWLCTVGGILILLSVMALAIAFSIATGPVGAGVAVSLLLALPVAYLIYELADEWSGFMGSD